MKISSLEYSLSGSKPGARPVSHFALILFSLIGVLSLLGIQAIRAEESGFLFLFHFDRELNIITGFSSLLLFCGAILAARAIQIGIATKRAAGGIVLILVFMALDESLKIHETSERLAGIDWQILYLPLFLFAAYSWTMMWQLGGKTFRWFWFAGASAWVISQLLEAGQWGWWVGPGDIPASNYHTLMMCEEFLEMSGSSFFVLALYHLLVADAKRCLSENGAKCRTADVPRKS